MFNALLFDFSDSFWIKKLNLLIFYLDLILTMKLMRILPESLSLDGFKKKLTVSQVEFNMGTILAKPSSSSVNLNFFFILV